LRTGLELANNGVLSFESTMVDNSSEIEIEIKNLGNDTLFISELSVSGEAFSVSNLVDSELIFNQISTVSVTFSPENPGQFTVQNGFQILSNDADDSPFILSLEGEGISSTDYIPIADARDLPEGTIVNIAGIVTVADEFAGPMYFQDETAGIAWFYSPMRDETATFFF
jgi:hypothetical protein